jgi:hypothetical protein
VRVSAPRDAIAVHLPTVRMDVGPSSSGSPEERSFACWIREGHLRVSPGDRRAPISVPVKYGHISRDTLGQIRFSVDVTPLNDWTVSVSGQIRGHADAPTLDPPTPLGERLAVLGDRAYGILHGLEEFRRRGPAARPDSDGVQPVLRRTIHAADRR